MGYSRFYLVSLKQELKLVFRRKQDMVNPLVFFVIAVTLFPLGVSPEPAFLQAAGAGIVWVAALLATLLSLEALFRADHDDGTLEQQVLGTQPLLLVVLAKVSCHWLVTGLPLLLLTPLLGAMLFLPQQEVVVLLLTLLLGTPALSVIGAVGAALTVAVKSGGVLLSLLILPFYIPVLIFATSAVEAAAAQLPVAGHLALLAACSLFALVSAPFATAAALRIGVSD